MSGIGDNPAILGGAAQRLLAGAGQLGARGPAPVHLWNPPFCGIIDMRIAADGTWHYNGSRINRPAMVKLFSTILRKDPDGYVLVTPVERVGITVDDAPFLAVEMAVEAGIDGGAERLFIRTTLDDVVEIGAAHPVRFTTDVAGGFKPYIHIRDDLWALASRALTQDLVARLSIESLGEVDMRGGEQANGQPQPMAGRAILGLRSGEMFFAAAPADEIGAVT